MLPYFDLSAFSRGGDIVHTTSRRILVFQSIKEFVYHIQTMEGFPVHGRVGVWKITLLIYLPPVNVLTQYCITLARSMLSTRCFV